MLTGAAAILALAVPAATARAQDTARVAPADRAPAAAAATGADARHGVADSDPEQSPPGGRTATRRPPARTGPEPAVKVRGLVDVGYVQFAASDSFNAVYDSNSGVMWGGGVQVAHRSGWFGQVRAARFAGRGQRVFVSAGDVFPLGIDTSLTIVPLEVTGGWRFLPRPSRPTPPRPGRPGQPTTARPPTQPAARRTPARPRRFVPYLGAGLGVVRVTEASDFAEAGDDVEESFTSYHLLGGVEYPVRRWVGVALEGAWRFVPDALAGDGVAHEFGETALDHLSLTFRVTIGR